MNRDSQGRLHHAAGAPASLGGKYAPDDRRGGAQATFAAPTVTEILNDEGYLYIPRGSDGNWAEHEREFEETGLADMGAHLAIQRGETAISFDAHGFSDEELSQFGLSIPEGSDYAELVVEQQADSITGAAEILKADPRFAIVEQLQTEEGRAWLKTRAGNSDPYDREALSTFDDDYRIEGYAPRDMDDFLEWQSEFPTKTTMGQLQRVFPDELDWWESKSQAEQREILEKYNSLEPQPESENPYYYDAEWHARHREAVNEICGLSDYQEPDSTIYDDPENSYMGGSAWVGSNYHRAKDMSRNEITQDIRKQLNEAKKNGVLPKAAKISIRKRGSGYAVTVKGMPSDLMTSRKHKHDREFDHLRGQRSDYATEVASRIERIASSYGRSSTNSMVDYFDSTRSAFVQFDFDES